MGALEEVRDLAEAVTRKRSISLWDVELGGQPGRSVVRVFVEADGGIDLDTVTQVSEEISRGLDLRDPIPGSYTLEVSSPGLERTLRLPEHFARSIGREVVVKTKEIVHGNSHRIEGVVVGVDEDKARIALSTGEIDIPIELIKSARTVFEWGDRSVPKKKKRGS
jgi:ribosome maturation factor RimP